MYYTKKNYLQYGKRNHLKIYYFRERCGFLDFLLEINSATKVIGHSRGVFLFVNCANYRVRERERKKRKKTENVMKQNCGYYS